MSLAECRTKLGPLALKADLLVVSPALQTTPDEAVVFKQDFLAVQKNVCSLSLS